MLGSFERIVVSVGPEVLSEVDSELIESVVVIEVPIGASVTDRDGRVVSCVMSLGLCEVAVTDMSTDDGSEVAPGDHSVDEDGHMDMQVPVVGTIAGMRFEDRETFVSAAAE